VSNIKKNKIVIFCLIGFLIIGFVGYFIGIYMDGIPEDKHAFEVIAPSSTPAHSQEPIVELNKIKELEIKLSQEKTQFNQITDQLSSKDIELKKTENEIFQLNVLKKKIKQITEIKNFEYEFVSNHVNKAPFDTVVYVKNVPTSLEEREIYLLKASLIFSDSKFKLVSLWDNLQNAMKYVSGDIGDIGPLGWNGLNSKFGTIDNSLDKPTLAQHYSSDDGAVLEFGKYTSN
jgi:hypothetical protein